MVCARRRGGMRNWSSSPTTAGTWVRRASRSDTLTRGMAPAAWPPSLGSEEPPAWLDRGLALSVWLATYFGGRILHIPVPHTGHTPFSPGRPFAIFTCCGFELFRLALHFTQYPSSAAIGALPAFAIALLLPRH